MNKVITLLLFSTLIGSGCAMDTQTDANASGYDVNIRWTSYGIPHVKADNWASLGYGFAYATATDAICVIAKDVQKVNGAMSAHFGADAGNVQSDIFHKAVLTAEKLAAYTAKQSPRTIAFNQGYVAGYNRYLSDKASALPASCADADWVQPITADDLTRLAMGVGIRYGLGRFQKEIAQAAPGSDIAEIAQTQWEWPAGIGSNAVAVGRDLSESGRGILLGNPHYPWHGSSRFHLIHTTIPGELDVMGTSLLTTNRVAIGFNKDIAWTHTVSTALRFTLYKLRLKPDDPYQYEYDGEYRPIETRTISVDVINEAGKLESQSHTAHFTHYGPIVESEGLPWTDSAAFALRDAVIDNYLTADTYDALNKATSTQEIEAAISKQGVYWTNTVAADRHGNALYADISGTPNVDKALIDQCQVDVEGLAGRAIVLRGNTSACEWYDDPTSLVPGTLPAAKMPRVSRDDYVTNSNDSYWLSNPNAPLEGYSPIIGSERSARSLRTRAGLTQMAELIEANETVSPENIQAMLYNHRNYGAELLLDDVLSVCQGGTDIQAPCDALSNWDRTMNIDSQGSHVWREFWDEARHIENVFAVPFDAENPVHTPAGINAADDTVRAAIRTALTNAATKLAEANIALDAPLGDIQYAQRNDKRIGIPGGEGWAGAFSMIVSQLQPDTGYNPIIHGNSYIQVISWDESGVVKPTAMLTYSQSPEPDSQHYSDLTEIYSAGGWIDLPFSEAEIASDPNLTEISLSE